MKGYVAERSTLKHPGSGVLRIEFYGLIIGLQRFFEGFRALFPA